MTARSMWMTGMCLGAALALSANVALAQSGQSAGQGTATKPAAQKPTEQKPPPPPPPKPTGAKPAVTKPAATSAALMTPSKLNETAPATFKVNVDTSAGLFVVEVTRAWAPKGADRFYNLVKNGYYDGNRFFRIVPKFMVQFGINGDPKIQSAWSEANITDDPVTQSNKRGYITFAKTNAPNSRTTQLFVNYKDNAFLDSGGFAPFGQVISGMEVVDKLNAEYGESPQQPLIQSQGNAYLTKSFPRLDYIKKATIVK